MNVHRRKEQAYCSNFKTILSQISNIETKCHFYNHNILKDWLQKITFLSFLQSMYILNIIYNFNNTLVIDTIIDPVYKHFSNSYSK